MTTHSIRETSSLNYIQGLDGLRAVSVLSVIAFHYAAYFAAQNAARGFLWLAFSHMANVGWVGVDVFLVISGLLITKIMVRRNLSASNFAYFLKRRVTRLLPAYIVLLLVFSAIALAIDPSSKVLRNSWSLWTITSNIQSSFGDRTALADNTFGMYHLWSIAIEWHFYVVFPLVICCCKSIRSAALAFIASAILCRTVFAHLAISDNAIYSFTLCRSDAFGIGSLVALIPAQRWSSYRPYAGLTGLLIFAGLLIAVGYSGVPFKTIHWLQVVGYTAIDASIAMVVWYLTGCSKSSIPFRIMESSWLRAIGRSSYSVYLWHLPLYPLVVTVAMRLSKSGTYAELMAFGIGGTMTAIFGFLSYRFVEFPFMSSRANPAATLPEQQPAGDATAVPS
jgi:peptidoglycan/LPS O-acetylase OafA/YrhL